MVSMAAVAVKLGLAGDTMLGRGVAEALLSQPRRSLFSSEVVEAAREADLFVLNLECCISTRGEPWPAPGKPFFFRAPPVALDVLNELGVDCVTLANNHALDFGYDALLDTFEHLRSAGIEWVGAGRNLDEARRPVVVETGNFSLCVVGATDHPEDFAAGHDRPGVAFADFRTGIPGWMENAIAESGAHMTLVTPHWGPNMTHGPLPYVKTAAASLRRQGAGLVAGHSAHVFHGSDNGVLYDVGDFVDDYAVDPVLRNDLGLLFFVTLEQTRAVRAEALPLKLDYCHTSVARGPDAEWIRQRFSQASMEFGVSVTEEDGRLVVDWAT